MKGVSSNQQKLNDPYLEGKVKKKNHKHQIETSCRDSPCKQVSDFIWLSKVFSQGHQDLDTTELHQGFSVNET